MYKVSTLVILILIVAGVIQINTALANQLTDGLIFYGKGTTESSGSFQDSVIRILINGDTATAIHTRNGMEVVRMNIQPSETCIQTQNTLCYDGVVTQTRNTMLHKQGDVVLITLDLQNNIVIMSFNSGQMQGTSVAIELSKIIVRFESSVIRFIQEGGIAGMQSTFTIDTDSALLIQNDRHHTIDSTSIDDLIGMMRTIKIHDIEDTVYPPLGGSADYFTYLIKLSHGPLQKTFSWTDASQDVPDELIAFKEKIVQISEDAIQTVQEPDIIPVSIAKEFVMTAPTFAFDGISESLSVVDVVVLESFPEQYVITLRFDSLHGGYGDRTDQVVTQAITPHTTIVIVVEKQVISAIIDDVWDELNQKPLR